MNQDEKNSHDLSEEIEKIIKDIGQKPEKHEIAKESLEKFRKLYEENIQKRANRQLTYWYNSLYLL